MEFKLPFLGENVKEAAVLSVLVKKGDSIEKDQPVLELESEKATFEVPAPASGTVTEVHVAKGAKVGVGQAVLTLEEKEPEKKEGRAESAPPKPAEPERKAPPQEKVEAAPARTEGIPPKVEPPAGPKEAAEPSARPPQPAAKPVDAREEQEEELVAAGPATRRLARELGVDLRQVRGSEAGGRITPEDVKAYVLERSPKVPEVEAPAEPDFERWGAVERRPLSGIEKTAVRRLSESWRSIPHVTHQDVADVTDLERARERYESARKPSEPKLTVTALVVKAAVAALRAFPQVNASLDMTREERVLKRYVHIGVAVDTEHGLLVPVVRDADRKTTRQIAAEIAGLAERARERKLLPDEMQGATFTVSNLGGIGGTAFTPIINAPEAAILGLSRTREEPARREGEWVPRLVLPLSLSYDHRLVNGADAARFARHLANLLEDPLHLLIES